MRKVASYLLKSATNIGGEKQLADHVCRLIERWIDSKGEIEEKAESRCIKFKDGRIAELGGDCFLSRTGTLNEYEMTEPTGAGLFQTVVRVASVGGDILIYVELRVSGNGSSLAPVSFDAKCPRLIQDIVDSGGEWSVGSVPVQRQPLLINGPDGAAALSEIIWHPERTLPIVVVSEFEGETITPSIADKIAADLCGLAVVAKIDSAAAWKLSSLKGKEWSCYNGAIRLYWPVNGAFNSHDKHPVWTRLSLLRNVMDARDASYGLRKLLRKRVFATASYTISEPQIFQRIRSEHRSDEMANRLRLAETQGDWREIAESYAIDNQALQEELHAAQSEIAELRARVANYALIEGWKQGLVDEPGQEVEIPPETVEDAVDYAKKRFSGVITFGDDVDAGVKTLAADAGPPDKVLHHLSALAELGLEIRNGTLKKGAVQWLRDKGINCSGESETIRNSRTAQRERTWSDGKGRRAFDLHLKPNDGTSPDRCARIYFDLDHAEGRVIIGWVGRHLG